MPGRSAASITEGMPTRISGRPRSAPAAAVRRSQAIASSKPAPRHAPLIMHTVGNGASCTRLIASCRLAMNALAVAGVNSRSTWSCMPPVVARPAPVITAARTVGVAPERVEGGADPLHHLGHDQVQRGPVEGDPGHAVVAVDADEIRHQ